MKRKRSRCRRQARTLLYLLRLKSRLLPAREPPGAGGDVKKVPHRLKIFLFLASKFSSEQVSINIPGDVLEEYEADCAERGEAEANKRLNKQILESILPLVYTFCLVKAIKAIPSKTRDLLLAVKKNFTPAHALSLPIILISVTVLLSSQWRRTLPTQEQRRVPISRNSNNGRAINRNQTDIKEVSVELTTPEKAELPKQARKQNKNSAAEKGTRRPLNALASITLTPLIVTRSGVEVERGTIILPANISRIRFHIILPEGSNGGSYRVQIEDPLGNVLLATSAKSRHGRALTFIANVRSLTGGHYYISVSIESASGEVEAPVYYQFAIRR